VINNQQNGILGCLFINSSVKCHLPLVELEGSSAKLSKDGGLSHFGTHLRYFTHFQLLQMFS